MLTRLHVKGYKSLVDVEVALKPLTLLFGPNAAGKSNLLDAVQLLSRLATSRTLKEAFEPPCRGKPLESFTMGNGGVKGLRGQERLVFSIEADLDISDAIAKAVDREILEMRRPANPGNSGKVPEHVRERRLRYRLAVEMLPSSGLLRITDEYLAALRADGTPTGQRRAFIERQGQKLHLRRGGQARPMQYERYLDRAILSMPHYAPHYPHLTAARRELESWRFFYFEPRERMRAATSIKEVRHVGAMGEELAAFLITLETRQPRQFQALEKALKMLLPDVEGIETEVNDLGEAEFRLRENGRGHSGACALRRHSALAGPAGLDQCQRSPIAGGLRGTRKRCASAPHRTHCGAPESELAIPGDAIHRHHALSNPSRPAAGRVVVRGATHQPRDPSSIIRDLGSARAQAGHPRRTRRWIRGAPDFRPHPAGGFRCVR